MTDESSNPEVTVADDLELESPEQIFKAIQQFYPGDETITHLKDKDIHNILRMYVLKSFYDNVGVDSAFIDTLVNQFMKLRISKDRLSRKEFFEAIKGMDTSTKVTGWLKRHARR